MDAVVSDDHDKLADPGQTWVSRRAEKTRDCLMLTTLAVAVFTAAFGVALGIARAATL
jgi:hypothetical protein